MIFVGSKERCQASGEEEGGEGGESAVREATETVWDRRSSAAEEGSSSLREMAAGGSNPKEKDDIEAAPQGASANSPVLQNFG